ncbi:lipoprotein LpqH [Propionibacterium australiense]|uniref:Mycobacterium 19 kDa lipoprotein antigen n=1 Tax=Propionibacterium australiense TaxID=119981 RepID=A0A383S865_9ACTN|nr:lipoprotein LpqH [Propionibacterium australiense]RLP09662.1 hypothetical protein D7U36_07685 [Propionibacterium australiense]RLP12364.1 hypothetical protein D9T14_00465 [Propionibacterium australiense]SYZ33569.1 Mycobacterium 19 kDa lipoprotein antigen [Propionibacterium australiense]VEH89555.1 Mycobacterium 19 kDa lipoprotein antigen [Propionibacterium australiense]
MKTPTKTIMALTLTTALALSLGACSGQSNTTESSSPAETATTSSAPEVTTGGDFSATIDGEPFTIDQPVVTCGSEDGMTTVRTASMTSSPSSFTVTLDENGQVVMVNAGKGSELVLSFMDAGGVGHAEATVDGSTYTVTGEAPAEVATDPSAPLRSFEMTATCG